MRSVQSWRVNQDLQDEESGGKPQTGEGTKEGARIGALGGGRGWYAEEPKEAPGGEGAVC